ncbi:MAG: metallophosphoesterase family protein [Pseudomarimonas sp.]
MSVLLQISDPHFGTEQAPVIGALTRFAHALRPAMVVLSGDLTQRALRRQFKAARQFVDGLKVPLELALPGNHDVPLFNLIARIFTPFGKYLCEFGPDLEPVRETPDLLVIGVNTTVPRWHKDGRVSAVQVERVAARLLQARPDVLRIVVVHQPVHVPRLSEQKNLLIGSDAAVHRWSDAGADIVMGGHIHLPFVRPLSERYPNLSRRMWAVQAGTAVSSRIRADAPNSVNVIRFDATQTPMTCTVERWDCELPPARFALIETHQLALDRSLL